PAQEIGPACFLQIDQSDRQLKRVWFARGRTEGQVLQAQIKRKPEIVRPRNHRGERQGEITVGPGRIPCDFELLIRAVPMKQILLTVSAPPACRWVGREILLKGRRPSPGDITAEQTDTNQ